MLMLTQAKLIKLKTDDGLVEIQPKIPIGKIYLVNPDSIRTEQLYNIDKQTWHVKEIIDSYNEQNQAIGFLPTEILQILYN